MASNGILESLTGSTTNGFPDNVVNGTVDTNGSDLQLSAPKRADIETTFRIFAEVFHDALRPRPTQTGDGTYLEEKIPSSLLKDFSSLGFKDVETLKDLLKQKITGGPTDDRSYLMERIIQLAAVLPPGSKHRDDLTTQFIRGLWDDLQHPPVSYLGDEHVYRQADGSNNNFLYPGLGAANTPYARTVQPLTVQNSALPDPGQLFDSFMVRKSFKQHPSNISSMLFYLASIIIHDLFLTSHEDFNKSKTSSYLDLAPLYGNNEDEQKEIRTGKDGKIKPDCFSEKRLLGFPPGAGCILIMFNRFHNHVVEQLAIINEGGRFDKSSDDDKTFFTKYDNDLFQTGRLIVCGLYINTILIDYVRTILNLNRTNSDWNLDPRVDVAKGSGLHGLARGSGNQVSAEFNLIYRWHSAVSERDDKWTQDLYGKMFPGQRPADVSMPELLKALGELSRKTPPDPQERPFAGLQRNADGTYSDDDLAKILVESIEDPAGSFGANNVPQILRPVEVLGIIQARKWNLATLNELRKFFQLKPHETFEEINSDPGVADQLRRLYDHPDCVELYPGVVVEEPKIPMTPGSGLATTFTISRAILSDAVSLVRGDRFYTVDFHPKKLTNWGFKEVQTDSTVEHGCVFYKLFLLALPNHFKSNSVYAHYPLTIPSENEKILTELGRVQHYDFARPTLIPSNTEVRSFSAARDVLESPTEFGLACETGLRVQLTDAVDNSPLFGSTPFLYAQRDSAKDSTLPTNWRTDVKLFMEDITSRLLLEKTYQIAGVNQVDVVRDIGNLTQAHLVSHLFCLPLKTEERPLGVFSEQELYQTLTVIYVRATSNLDPAKRFSLTEAVRTITQQLGTLVKMNVEANKLPGMIASLVDKLHEHHAALKDYGAEVIRRLLDTGLSADEVTWTHIIPSAAAMVATQGQVFAEVINFFLLEENAQYFAQVQKLASIDTDEANDKILHYALEASRLSTTSTVTRQVLVPTNLDDDGTPLSFKPGSHVSLNLHPITHSPTAFPSPTTFDPTRPLASYIHHPPAPSTSLARSIAHIALTSMLKTVAKLPNLRRAPGEQGRLKTLRKHDGRRVYMREDWSEEWLVPTSMRVQFDGPLPSAKE
ncbi:MAG: hypothetical protein M1833_006747 [Piccolia ochrophora]|nr:MAG: hypothetical protein M1833_006747 [Piccolia ochrophora]